MKKFGNRILENENVWDHNAWDNMEFTAEQQEAAMEKINAQKLFAVSPEKVVQFNTDPSSYWNAFYAKNNDKFFKDRNWLYREFPEILNENLKIIELGCGAGNTVFPFIKSTLNSFCFCCDYSSNAVNLVKSNPLYDESRCLAFVYDLTANHIPPQVEPNSLDFCVCIFVLSAIEPADWSRAVENIYKMLKPGGMVLIRDYARYDLTQLRFKQNRLLQDNFYVRGDGTRVYFFEQDEIESMFSKFHKVQCLVDRRLLVNRMKKLKMYRCWIQAKFTKPENK